MLDFWENIWPKFKLYIVNWNRFEWYLKDIWLDNTKFNNKFNTSDDGQMNKLETS